MAIEKPEIEKGKRVRYGYFPPDDFSASLRTVGYVLLLRDTASIGKPLHPVTSSLSRNLNFPLILLASGWWMIMLSWFSGEESLERS